MPPDVAEPQEDPGETPGGHGATPTERVAKTSGELSAAQVQHPGASDTQLLTPPPQAPHGLKAAIDSLEDTVPLTPVAVTPGARQTATSPGTTFGKYVLLEELGRGGMGVVYKARQPELDRLVAVKMILSNQLASKDQIDRFHAEARAAAQLKHPHIVRVYEAGEIDGQHYFAMEFLSGPNLAAMTKKGPLELEQAAGIVAKIARAVDHLHSIGIVHRDLKPANIVLDESGRPCVTDFGLVKLLEGGSHMTSAGAVVGTPSYMAPEQAAGKVNQVGPLSDVYSLGAILYELVTGKPPFREPSALDTLVQVIEGEATSPSWLNPAVPRSLECICLKCLEKDPRERYASAEALAEDIERYLDGEDVEAQPIGPLRRFQRWVRRHPSLAVHLIGLTIAASLAALDFAVHPALDRRMIVPHFTVLALWALGSLACQFTLRRGAKPEHVQMAWHVIDFVALGFIVFIHDGVASPMVLAYGLLICGAGLGARPRLVWFATALGVITFGLLVLEAAWRRTEIPQPYNPPLILTMLALLGFVTALQARRMRMLSRYYDDREKR